MFEIGKNVKYVDIVTEGCNFIKKQYYLFARKNNFLSIYFVIMNF